MKNKLIALLLLMTCASLSAMNPPQGYKESPEGQASKIFRNYNIIKRGGDFPRVDADGRATFEALTSEGSLIQVRFTKELDLDQTFGNNGVEIIEGVGTDYEPYSPFNPKSTKKEKL